LVQEVVPADQLVERALAAARGFQPVPTATLLATRRLLDSAASEPLDALLDAEEQAMCQAAATETFRPAVEAFLRPR
jgi:enoyl-CoA hydratase/carnithine racemase